MPPDTDTVVAITGASAGIGRATALRLARDGATSPSAPGGRIGWSPLAARNRAAGGHALVVPADVTSATDMEPWSRGPSSSFGRLDVMICNAGFGIAGSIDRTTPDADADAPRDVNYIGTFLAARAALPVFRRQGRGHLIIVSSIVGKRGVPFMGALRRDQVRAGRARRGLRAELRRHGHPRQRRLSRSRPRPILRRDDARDRHDRDARVRTAAARRRGGRRHRPRHRTPGAGGVSAPDVARARRG